MHLLEVSLLVSAFEIASLGGLLPRVCGPHAHPGQSCLRSRSPLLEAFLLGLRSACSPWAVEGGIRLLEASSSCLRARSPLLEAPLLGSAVLDFFGGARVGPGGHVQDWEGTSQRSLLLEASLLVSVVLDLIGGTSEASRPELLLRKNPGRGGGSDRFSWRPPGAPDVVGVSWPYGADRVLKVLVPSFSGLLSHDHSFG